MAIKQGHHEALNEIILAVVKSKESASFSEFVGSCEAVWKPSQRNYYMIL